MLFPSVLKWGMNSMRRGLDDGTYGTVGGGTTVKPSENVN